MAPVSTSLPAAPSPRSPPWGGTQGVKSSGSPWLLRGAEETLIKVLTGKETHTHTWAWVEESDFERRLGSRLPRPASHTPGNATAAAAARAILSAELGAAGPGGRRGGGWNEGAGGEPGLRAKRPRAAD